VVMARVSLVVRNTESSGGFVDDKIYTIAGDTYCTARTPSCDVELPAAFEDHRRQVYSRTVGLRNVAGRREVQP